MTDHLKKLRDKLIVAGELDPVSFRASFDAATKELMRVIEILRVGLSDVMDVDDRNESATWDIADSALARAASILNGEKK